MQLHAWGNQYMCWTILQWEYHIKVCTNKRYNIFICVVKFLVCVQFHVYTILRALGYMNTTHVLTVWVAFNIMLFNCVESVCRGPPITCIYTSWADVILPTLLFLLHIIHGQQTFWFYLWFQTLHTVGVNLDKSCDDLWGEWYMLLANTWHAWDPEWSEKLHAVHVLSLLLIARYVFRSSFSIERPANLHQKWTAIGSGGYIVATYLNCLREHYNLQHNC